ncbi:hypothetical protein VTN77DRAFT_5349 [Rasamsonia byssochlamydoides]|uniref:uncharacterized protein n=1 Tax=Rasamsonia byssochlamydoides TaxID=89139 RepID=UPI003743841E
MVLLPGYGKPMSEDDNFGVDWVIYYQFEDIEESQAIDEYSTLIRDLDAVGLETEVRHGNGASLLVFVKAPRQLLGNWIFKARVRDWLYGITQVRPVGDSQTIVEGETEAEDLRSINHLVSWQKEKGGAGITVNFGKWKNIKASFPLHNQAANRELLRRWSRTTILTNRDLDAIRALFGEKVAFYFAFTQCYSLFLVFPAVFGVICWLYFGSYSIVFAVVNCLWCVVFVEYWTLKETDLSIRWGVKGVGVLKANRMQYIWDKEVTDPMTGEVRKVFSTWKQVLRQLLQIPFALVAGLALGTLIVVIFAIEVFISEVYQGPFKTYLDFLPTILFSISLPSINSALTSIATWLTNYENYRTEDQYELAQTQKTFVLNFITSFLPIILTAFVYVPFGGRIVPYLDVFRVVTTDGASSFFLWSDQAAADQQRINSFHVDPARLRQEVIYLTVTAQVLSFGEEMVLPHLKRILMQKYRNYKNKSSEAAVRKRRYSEATNILLVDNPDEKPFLTRIRNEAEADVYNVQEDILEMCIQFGYLTLFGVAWPLVPLGFLLNNWLELRGDFFKISSECQRPAPIRADTIGPWLDVLSFLSWLGTLSTAAIVHLYRSGSMEDVQLWSLLLTVFVAEQAYLALRFLVRTTLEKIGSDTVRREEARKYAVRKRYLETFSEEAAELSTRPKPRVRFNETTDVVITPTKGSFGDSDSDSDSDSGFEKDDTRAKDLRRRNAIRRINEKLKEAEDDDEDEDQPHAPFKGGLCRTDSGTLEDAERAMRFWSAQKTAQDTIDAGIKLIKVLASVGRSRKARADQLKQVKANKTG